MSVPLQVPARPPVSLRREHCRGAHVVWAMALVALGCAPPRPQAPVVAPSATPALSEEAIKPVERPQLAIVDLDERPGPDRHTITVAGTLVNRGTGPTRTVYVHVDAVDHNGAVILSTDSEPSTEAIAPGGTANFSVSFENRPEIEHYHVEAISR